MRGQSSLPFTEVEVHYLSEFNVIVVNVNLNDIIIELLRLYINIVMSFSAVVPNQLHNYKTATFYFVSVGENLHIPNNTDKITFGYYSDLI